MSIYWNLMTFLVLKARVRAILKAQNHLNLFSTHLPLLLLSHVSRVRLCATLWTVDHQAPPSLGFSRQEHWSGLPFPSPLHENEKWKSKITCYFLSTPKFIFIVDILNNTNNEKRERDEKEGPEFCSKEELGLNLSSTLYWANDLW